jgi:hypothetical protein
MDKIYYKAVVTFNDGFTETMVEGQITNLLAAVGDYCKELLEREDDPASVRIMKIQETATGNRVLSSFYSEE